MKALSRLMRIEHAHLSILCEIRALLQHQLGMSNDDIADLFDRWYNDEVSSRPLATLLVHAGPGHRTMLIA